LAGVCDGGETFADRPSAVHAGVEFSGQGHGMTMQLLALFGLAGYIFFATTLGRLLT
jgi:hypothetical protein